MSEDSTSHQNARTEQAEAFLDKILPLAAFDIENSRDNMRNLAKSYTDGQLSQEKFDEITARCLKQYEPITDKEVAAEVEARRRPALMLNLMPKPEDAGVPGCWLGGLPTLPSEIDWPMADLEAECEIPMHFIAQIDLSQVPRRP